MRKLSKRITSFLIATLMMVEALWTPLSAYAYEISVVKDPQHDKLTEALDNTPFETPGDQEGYTDSSFDTWESDEPMDLEADTDKPEDSGPTVFETSVDNVTVKVEAEAGTFPEDATLVVEKANEEEEKEASEAVDEVRPENINVAASYTFDIKITDSEGNELQPEEGKTVNISFVLDRAADTNLTADIYHVETEETEVTDLSTDEVGIDYVA